MGETMTDEELCAQLYRNLCEASMRKDASAIDAVLADDYVLVHMTGMQQGKVAYIEAVCDGTLNYYSTEHDSIDVAIASDGAHARICGKSRVNAAVFGGGRHTWRLQQDLLAEKRNGTWLLVESRASTY